MYKDKQWIDLSCKKVVPLNKWLRQMARPLTLTNEENSIVMIEFKFYHKDSLTNIKYC